MSTSGPPSRPRPSSRPPRSVVVVAAAAVLEAVGLAALGGWGVTQLVAGVENTGVTVFLVVFALAVAAALVASARALLAGRRAGRAPVATWQLLQAASAFVVVQTTGSLVAWFVMALSVVVFVLLLTRPVVEHTIES